MFVFLYLVAVICNNLYCPQLNHQNLHKGIQTFFKNMVIFTVSETISENLRVLVKKKSESNPNYGYAPDKRPIKELLDYGIVNVDKPSGPTSHQVSSYVKDILNIGKCGHSGTLDPKVTGVLTVALGRATRVVDALLKIGKEYVCVMHLHKEVDEKEIIRIFKEFEGEIEQLPPVKSAIKRRLRKRTVYYIKLLEIKGKDVLFVVGCQAGTYIRKLVHDMGQKLGTGAHMAELRRTRVGHFAEDSSFTLQDITDAFYYYQKSNEIFLRNIVRPIEEAVVHLPHVWVMDNCTATVCHGADINIPGISKLHSNIEKESLVAVMTLKDELIAFGISNMTSDEMMREEKGKAVKVTRVFMKPGIYPK